MNWRILKRDFKRKKSVNVILMVLVVLATTFIAGGVKNFVTVTNAIDKFIAESELADYTLITSRNTKEDVTENDREIETFLQEQDEVKKYWIDEMIGLSQNSMRRENGKKVELNNLACLTTCDIKQQKFFDKEDRQITDVKIGTVYFDKNGMEKNNLKEGEKITLVSENGFKKTLVLKGYTKDAFGGSEQMGVERLLVSSQDYADIFQNGDFGVINFISVWFHNYENRDAFISEFNEEEFVAVFTADKDLVSLSYVMDVVMAAILLMVSFCLIILSVVMLRFTIIFTVNEDYKEIGIMMAIGLKNFSIRKIYLIKYAVITFAGALLGFCFSIPFGKAMAKPISDLIVIREENKSLALQAGLSLLVVFVILLFAYLSTGRIKKLSAMDAIRSGNNGERFKKKGCVKLSSSKRRASTFLAVNDVLSEPKRYFVLALIGMVATWMLTMTANTINTLSSNNMAGLFGLSQSEFVIDDEETIKELMAKQDKQVVYDYINDSVKKLKQAGVPVKKATMELFYRIKVQKGNKSYKSFSMQGLNTKMEEYTYIEGTPPKQKNEVAVTKIVADKLNAEIGDRIVVFAGEKKEYLITAIFQSMTNVGEGIRFTETADITEGVFVSSPGIQIRLDKVSEEDTKEMKEYQKNIEQTLNGVEVKTMSEYIGVMLGGISEKLMFMKVIILIVVIAIIVLITSLMQKMFLAREEGTVILLKSLGFSNAAVIRWQVKRVTGVLACGVLLGIVTAEPFSRITSGQVFKMMGAFKIEFVIRPVEVYILYPAVILATAVAGCVAMMRRVRKLKTADINDMM